MYVRTCAEVTVFVQWVYFTILTKILDITANAVPPYEGSEMALVEKLGMTLEEVIFYPWTQFDRQQFDTSLTEATAVWMDNDIHDFLNLA